MVAQELPNPSYVIYEKYHRGGRATYHLDLKLAKSNQVALSLISSPAQRDETLNPVLDIGQFFGQPDRPSVKHQETPEVDIKHLYGRHNAESFTCFSQG